MSLPSLQLDAFVAVAKFKSFSEGAKSLSITQSALSQRILNLESELGSSLFVREPAGIRMTELGQKLLRYCLAKDLLEEEFLGTLRGEDETSLKGILKIGGFSTIVRSVLLPSITPLINQNPELQIEFFTKEIRELPSMLESGEAGFILFNRAYERQGVINVKLGYEDYVLVEPKSGLFRENVFLDHDPHDSTTEDFFKIQTCPPKEWKRSYFDEIYTIIDGVLSGMGRAVIPLHIAKKIKGLEVSKGFRPFKTPVYLCYYEQAYYTLLQKAVIQQITEKAPKILSS